MPRTLDPAAHAIRRDTFVDAAQALITAKGYEEMSIQDVLVATGASKGAFYHYFDSKADLLDAVIERMVVQAVPMMEEVVGDPDLPALDKLRTLFSSMARWKLQRSDLVIAVLRVWAADENAIVREKFRRRSAEALTPLFARIVAQGQAEGHFSGPEPDHAARVLMALQLSAGELATDLLLASSSRPIPLRDVMGALAAYPEACERLLGLAPGEFPFVEESTLRAWFPDPLGDADAPSDPYAAPVEIHA